MSHNVQETTTVLNLSLFTDSKSSFFELSIKLNNFGHHLEYKESGFSEAYQEPSPYDYHREPSNWESGDTQPTQTIEMIDKKWPDGTKYEGMSLGGQFHGRGIYTYPNGDVYVGEFRFGKIQGEGQFSFTNGDKYEGSVSENKMHGKGKMTFAAGGHYMGYFSNNQFQGEGVLATPEKVGAGNWDRGIFINYVLL